MRSATRMAVGVLLAVSTLLSAWPLAAADVDYAIVAGTSWNSQRKVAVAPDGTIYFTSTGPANNTTAIYVEKSEDNGATWSELPRLGTTEAFRSSVAVDSRGFVHVAWTEFVGPDRQVFYARWEGGPGWLGSERLSDTPGYSGFPSLAVDSQDRVHLVWYGFDGSTYQVYYRYLDASGWHATVQATHGAQDANNPAIAIGPDDQVHVAFFTYVRGEVDVWYMIGGPAGWNLLQRVNPAGVPSTSPSIAVESDGTAVIAYASGSNTTLEVRAAERDAAGNWSHNVPVSALGEGGNNPSVVVGPSEGLAVFYETSAGTIRYRLRQAGVWQDSVEVHGTLHGEPARWVSASWAAFPARPADTSVNIVWTQESFVPNAFNVNFTRVQPFTAPADCKCGGPPWYQGLVVPALFLFAALASLGGLWVASGRTKGGGRG